MAYRGAAAEAWHGIRTLRSDPPAHAGSGRRDARGRTFGAALEQAEQLWSASTSVRPEAAPLLLFYCLSPGWSRDLRSWESKVELAAAGKPWAQVQDGTA